MVAALGADVEIALEVGTVQHGLTGRTLALQAFRNRLAPGGRVALDLGRQELLEPAHRAPPGCPTAASWRARPRSCRGNQFFTKTLCSG